MFVRATRSPAIYVVFLTPLTLSGCGWVDSASSGQSASESVIPDVYLANAGAVSIEEQQTLVASMTGSNSTLRGWQWTVVDGTSRSCESIDGFDYSYAESTLLAACTDSTDCEINVTEVEGQNTALFNISVPSLRAPVQIDYEVISTSLDGARIIRTQTLCALAINEAPEAIDDHFIVLAGEERISLAGDPDSLLANDHDDVDNRNTSLSVDTVPVEQPSHASEFTLQSDGSFRYVPDDDINVDENTSLQDSFTYSVTDGLHSVVASATIEVIASNAAPEQVSLVPDVLLTEVEEDLTSSASVDLANYFSDPDGHTLYFSIDRDALPETIETRLSSTGLLSVTTSDQTEGNWPLSLMVTDGIEPIDSQVMVYAGADWAGSNRAPTVTDINNTQVSGTFSYDVSTFFTDPDGDELNFSAIGLPVGVNMTSQGVINGVQDANNLGHWFVTVVAEDPDNASANDSFILLIQSG